MLHIGTVVASSLVEEDSSNSLEDPCTTSKSNKINGIGSDDA